jgi:hypothetical protein
MTVESAKSVRTNQVTITDGESMKNKREVINLEAFVSIQTYNSGCSAWISQILNDLLYPHTRIHDKKISF